MRTFKIKRRLPKHVYAGVKKNKQKAMQKSKLTEGEHKARLKRSGLWDESAARKCKLVVYRVGEEPKP